MLRTQCDCWRVHVLEVVVRVCDCWNGGGGVLSLGFAIATQYFRYSGKVVEVAERRRVDEGFDWREG